MSREVRDVRRREEPRAVLHGMEGVRLTGRVDPRIDEPVRMIDAQAVELAQGLVDAAPEEAQSRVAVLPGIEQRVVPGLPGRIGAARRRAHPERRQEDGGVAPDVLVRDADLQVAAETQAEGPRLGAESLVLLVREELVELVTLD